MHQRHIIQVLLIMILMVFEEKGEKCDLLIIVLRELCKAALLQRKIQQNLMEYEIIIYNVHGVMHLPPLNLILFEGNVNYDLKILRMNKLVRLLHIIAGEVWFDFLGIKGKRKRKKNKTITSTAARTSKNDKMLKNGVLLMLHHYVHQKHNIQLLSMILMVFEEKGEKNKLVIVVMVKLFEVVLEKHKIHKSWMKYEIGYNVHPAMYGNM